MYTTAPWLMRVSREFIPDVAPIVPGASIDLSLHRRGGYGEEYFTLSGTYFQGRPPKSVNFYWRRFRIDDIPLDDHDHFDVWLRERWYEKDAAMETYKTTGRFPPNAAASDQVKTDVNEYIETEVRTKYWWEFLRIFIVVGIFALLGNIVAKIWYRFTHILA